MSAISPRKESFVQMKAGFRVWLFRWVAGLTGIIGLFVFLSLDELSRLYGFSQLAQPGFIGMAVSFLLFTSALIGVWTWKRYSIVSLSIGFIFVLVYLVWRPEMYRDDILAQLKSPALTADLIFYRGIALKDDPTRDAKIERLNFAYGFLRTYGTPPVEPKKEPIPEAK